jgi:uracil-DNA glycosylase
MALVPFRHTLGPKSAKILCVGEAWGKDEEECGKPFVGQSGRELARMACEAGLLRNPLPERWLSSRDMIYYWEASPLLLTNVLALRPPNNNLDALCVPKAESNPAYPPLRQGKYLRPDLLPELERLQSEIQEIQPNLILAMGNTACWAVMRSAKISQIRGTAGLGPQGSIAQGLKILPTFHPAAVLRNWALRPIVVADLIKAKLEGGFPDLRRPKRQVLVNPTLAEIEAWLGEAQRNASILSVDIETGAGQIKCIGFSWRIDAAMVVSFVDLTKDSGNFWEDEGDEARAWSLVRALLALPCPKLFQNGLYDLQYLLHMGLRPRNCLEDTMLLHHSLFPEMQKGLGFLGSIYTSEPAWKLMRLQSETLKKDD